MGIHRDKSIEEQQQRLQTKERVATRVQKSDQSNEFISIQVRDFIYLHTTTLFYLDIRIY